MKKLLGGAGLIALLLLPGCSRTTTTYSVAGSGAERAEAEVTDVISRALDAEALGVNADSLYASAPLIVVNGRQRVTTPLFANVGTGGTVAISSSQLEIRAGLAWGLVEYRWSSREGVTREGRATFVLKPGTDGRWRIQHVHSSSPR
jgi:ketosteroid isomerase-like protein